MKTLLQTFDQLSNFTLNLELKFWWWPLETIIHRSYSEGFEYKIFTRPKNYIYFLSIGEDKSNQLFYILFPTSIQFTLFSIGFIVDCDVKT
jgi:hypothetical protein